MKIACYCQHVLGIGHFHRSLEICKTLATNHETVMILGGPDVDLKQSAVHFLQLPGLQMNTDFSNLLPCEKDKDLEAIKRNRKRLLFNFFASFQPDVFLIELYPFGRKAFRFELDPILKAVAAGTLAPCLRLCSLRDILVEKKDKAKYETRVLKQLRHNFDGLLIHSDPAFIPLQKTFSNVSSIPVPHYYTGFITPATAGSSGTSIRNDLGLSRQDSLVVASIGGGNVGAELLKATAAATVLLQRQKRNIHVHLFTGPYSAPNLAQEINQLSANTVIVHDFCSNFPQWLDAADLSISMAGYNTCMNLLAAGIPALLYPFGQNREQHMRITAFTSTADFTLLEVEDLQPESLAAKILHQLKFPKKRHHVQLDGAPQSAGMISDLQLWSETA